MSDQSGMSAMTERGAIDMAIATLQSDNKRLRAALEPFVRAAGFHCIEVQTDDSLQVLVKVAPGLSGALTVRDFRRAREASEPAR